MKTLVRNFFSSLPFGTRLFLLIYAAGLVAWLGVYLHWFDAYQWLALSPALVWKGQVWRVVSYAFLPNSPLDWILSLFWLATLVSILGRNFSALGFWAYSLLSAVATALFVLLLQPKWPVPVAGCGGMTFALLVAWDRLYRRERLILLGIGEISVRQAVILIAIINSLILFFCSWFLMLGMWCGGIAGWIYFLASSKRLMDRRSAPVQSERIARLEL
jgi:membrane associated rhomboid family serine protease